MGVQLILASVPRTTDTACHHSTWEFRASLHYILEFKADLVSSEEVGGASGGSEEPKKDRERACLTGSARANVLGSQKPRTERSLRGALRYGRAGEEEASGGRNGVRLPDLACFLEGVWERWAAGEAAASPPCPPPRPAGSLRNPKRGQAPCQGGGVPGPPRPAAASPDGAHVLVMARLASRQQPRIGMGWQDPELECERVSARGKLYAGIAGGGFGALSPRGLRKDSPLPQGRIPLDQAPPVTTPQDTHGGGGGILGGAPSSPRPRPLTVEFWTGLCHDHAPISVCGF